jgi:peptide deformylase
MTTKDLQDLRIVHYGHPALRQQAAPVGRVTAEVKAFVERMAELLQEAHGLGLAANQVGVPRRIMVVMDDGELIPLIDPELADANGSENAEEGCLSLPRLYGHVERPTRVVVVAKNLSGKRFTLDAEGMVARAVSHELDHLDGRLFVDQVDQSTLHWLVRTGEGEEAVTQATTLEDALKFFLFASGVEKR